MQHFAQGHITGVDACQGEGRITNTTLLPINHEHCASQCHSNLISLAYYVVTV